MDVVHNISELEFYRGGVCVPTMGALHEGHLSLISYARGLAAGPVVVTNFVNPTQFGPEEDLSKYPRTLEQDCNLCEELGVDVVFAPSIETVYPDGLDKLYVPALPDVAIKPGLEDAKRPKHFAGVCQVVYRLFEIVQPAIAVFGEKDYQQLLVIKAMVEQERLGINIIGRPTVRESDGLAMSSRNRYLSVEEHKQALAINQALQVCKTVGDPCEAERIMRSVLDEYKKIDVEYAVVRDGITLMPVSKFVPGNSFRALIAARVGGAGGVGGTRLIDNMAVNCSH